MKNFKFSVIIDDDPIFIYGTKRLMKELDFCEEIVVYNNGKEAYDGLISLVASQNSLPDIIFLDLNMPIMDGWEFLEEFNKIQNPSLKKINIYIISSSIDPRDLERVKNYKQVHNYILKPVNPKDLESILHAS